ncbi:MAG: hypothetical protein ABI707_02430 [Ferruginibacter sp.]
MTTFTKPENKTKKTAGKSLAVCSGYCEANSISDRLSCKLTRPELRQRKETVIKSLKNQMLTRKELKNGYSYKIAGTDKMLTDILKDISHVFKYP